MRSVNAAILPRTSRNRSGSWLLRNETVIAGSDALTPLGIQRATALKTSGIPRRSSAWIPEFFCRFAAGAVAFSPQGESHLGAAAHCFTNVTGTWMTAMPPCGGSNCAA